MLTTTPLRRRLVFLIFSSLFVSLLVFLPSQDTRLAAGSLTLTGTVQTPTGGNYTQGGWVNLSNNTNGYGSGLDQDGRFEIIGVEPGTYTLDVSADTRSGYANPAQQQVTITGNVSNFIVRLANPVIKGVLAKPDGTATNGCVNLRDRSYTINRGTCPSDDGKFTFGSLEVGTYIIESSPPDNSPYVGAEVTVTVTNPSATIDLGAFKLENPFIVGKVALPNGNALAWSDDWDKRLHLSVDLWNTDNTLNKHSNYDQNSKFKFGKVPAGTYRLRVSIWDTELYTSSVEQTITVPAAGLDLTASPVKLTTPQLVGTVYRPDGATPVQNAWVTLHNEDWSLNQGSSTDSLGKYRIGGLPAGTYKFEVSPPGDMNDVVRQDPVDVSVTADSTVTRNVTLSAAKKFITGTVKKKDGTGVSCAQVNANRRDGSGWANTRTASDGSYTLTVQPGAWNVRVERDYSFDCPEPDWNFLDPEAIVEFSNDSTTQVESVHFTVQTATAIMTGTVKKQDGTPITQGNVNANSQTPDGRNRWANAEIKADGRYRLNLVAGIYDVNVWVNNPKLYTKNQKVTVADQQTVTANFLVQEKLARITGAVTTKSGAPLPNIQLNGNLDCGPQGCSAWSNTRTDADGKYDLAATAGRWNLNVDAGQSGSYVYDGPPVDVYVPSETATVPNVNFSLTYADVTVKGKIVDENGKPFADFPGWVFVRPLTIAAGESVREYGGPINQGTFNFRVPSTLFREAELGVHAPPNSRHSPVGGQTIVLVADATIEKDIVVKQNDAAIVGRVVSQSGFTLDRCGFRGEVFANTSTGQWYGTQVNPDCSYELSLVSGTYHLGYYIEESAGFLNRPPTDKPITVASGTRVEQNLIVIAGDAKLSVLVLEPDGTPARRVWVWADNHEEIDQRRREAEVETREQEEFRGPGGTTSPEEVFAYCSKKENERECDEFKLPPGAEGPGGCQTMLECTRYCTKHRDQCFDDGRDEDRTAVRSVALSNSVLRRKAELAGLKLVRAKAEDEPDDDPDEFDDYIGTGSETNDLGQATLTLLSDHVYTVNASTPPESDLMPAKHATVDLEETKSASLTLQLREADGKMVGFVTWNDRAVEQGWVGCWSEDGNSTGASIQNGTYRLNYTFNSSYHCEANSSVGEKFLRSEEHIVTITRQKTVRENFTLGEANFTIPPPVSETFDATQPHVITLADGTRLNIPANAIASSGQVTVVANPTINIQSQKTARPLGYGYNFEATDADRKVITTFPGEITATFQYTDEQLKEAGIEEDALVPSYWDSASRTWKKPNNVTQDKEENTITVRTNHFTAYALVSSSGQGRGQALTPVRVEKRKGQTQVVVGRGANRKTFTPFPGYRGKVEVGTLVAAKLGQVIAAGQGGASPDPTVIKVFNLKGKRLKTVQLWGKGYRRGLTLAVTDVTKDARDDLIASPKAERTVKVYSPSQDKIFTIRTAGRGSIIAQALDLKRTGTRQIVTSVGSRIEVWQFGKKGFSKLSFDQRKLKVRGTTIERVYLQPVIESIKPRSAGRRKSFSLTIRGENLGQGSQVIVNGVPAKKVAAQGERTLTVTFDFSKFKKGAFDLQLVNPDGVQITKVRAVRIK